MSEHDEGEGGFVSIGERLRRAREARAMTLDDVANQTRIPMRHLQHIETEDWEALPAPTYAIGFTRNYAHAVGLDGAAIANELRERIGGPRRRAAPAPEYYEPADPARVPPKGLIVTVLVLAALLVGGYALWRNTLGADGEAPSPAAGAPGETNLVVTENGQAAAAPDPAGQTVTLTALSDVWLSVTDGEGGAALFSGILSTGQSFTVPATATRPVLRTGRPHVLRASAAGRDLGLIAPEERTVDNISLLPAYLAARAAGQPARPAPSTPTSAARPGRTRASAPAAEPPPSPPSEAPLSVPLPQ